MRWEDLRAAWEAEPDFQEAYRSEYPYHAVADAIVELRKEHGLTQSELAALAGTSQPVIARVESGTHAVRVDLLNRIADGLELVWRPRFEAPASTQMVIHESAPARAPGAAARPGVPMINQYVADPLAGRDDAKRLIIGRSANAEPASKTTLRVFFSVSGEGAKKGAISRPALALAS